MGSEKQSGSSTTVVNQTSTPTPTAAEQEMQNLQLEQYKQTVGPQTQAQLSGLSLVNQLLTGQMPQGELYKQISGIDPTTIANQASIYAQKSLPGFQSMGLSDSGVMQREISRGIANELMYPAEQFNVGARQNLLNLALTGQAQVQAPVQAGTNTLASSLAGLRSVNTSGTTSGTTSTYGMNPFLNSFQQSLGQGLGQGVAAAPFALMCWVAKEIFGSWEHPKTVMARYYIGVFAPAWFRNFYLKHGEAIAEYIHDKPLLKLSLRPLFEVFALLGRSKYATKKIRIA